MELWISTSTNVSDYQLLQTYNPGAGTFFTTATQISYDLTTLPTYQGYAIARAVGQKTVSNFSTPSNPFSWTNDAISGVAQTANTATNAILVNTNHLVDTTDFYLNMVNAANAGGYVGVEYNTGVVYSSGNSTLSSPHFNGNTVNVNALSSPPTSPQAGTVALADNKSPGWQPIGPPVPTPGTPILVLYNGSNWVKLG
jgi:hypothetical protein